MKLEVLGSSGTAPQPGNPASGYLVRSEEALVWMDAGPGTYQVLIARVDPEDIDAVLLSHMHSDHCTDVFALAHSLAYVRGSERVLPVVAPDGSVARVQGFLGGEAGHAVLRALAFEEAQPGAAFALGDLEISPQAAHHSVPALSYRIAGPGGTLGYTGDTGPSEMLDEHFAGVDLLMAEASLAPSAPDFPFHMTARQAGEMAAAAGARRLLLTHIPEGIDLDESVRLAGSAFDGPVGLALPGDSYMIESPE